MGDGADELAVLHDGAAAHSLQYSARFTKKRFIYDANEHTLLLRSPLKRSFYYLYLVFFWSISQYGGIDDGTPRFYVLSGTYGDRRHHTFIEIIVDFTINAIGVTDIDRPNGGIPLHETTDQFPGCALFGLFKAVYPTFIDGAFVTNKRFSRIRIYDAVPKRAER